MKRALLIVLAVVFLLIAGLLLSPIGPVPGGALAGEFVAEPVTDWSFLKDERFCQLETKSPEPRSITVTCIVSDKQLYVGCSSCAGRNWSQQLIVSPSVRYGALGKVYALQASRVKDPHELDQVWRARAKKNGQDRPDPKPDDFWFFRLGMR
ncbi:MAG: hypothetical protein AAF438_11565 [Pseudomonadota bacterium]